MNASKSKADPARSSTPTPVGIHTRPYLKLKLGKTFDEVVDDYIGAFGLQMVVRAQITGMLDVASKTYSRDGRVKVKLQDDSLVDLADCINHYYVDPTSKLLAYNRSRVAKEEALNLEREKAVEKAKLYRKCISADLQAHWLHNQWVIVELAKLGEQGPRCFDVMLGRQVGGTDRTSLFELYGRRDTFGVQKRALTYREVQALSLEVPKA